jgi:hypothetical protein
VRDIIEENLFGLSLLSKKDDLTDGKSAQFSYSISLTIVQLGTCFELYSFVNKTAFIRLKNFIKKKVQYVVEQRHLLIIVDYNIKLTN